MLRTTTHVCNNICQSIEYYSLAVKRVKQYTSNSCLTNFQDSICSNYCHACLQHLQRKKISSGNFVNLQQCNKNNDSETVISINLAFWIVLIHKKKTVKNKISCFCVWNHPSAMISQLNAYTDWVNSCDALSARSSATSGPAGKHQALVARLQIRRVLRTMSARDVRRTRVCAAEK